MTDADRIEFLAGEVDALLAFASAVIKSHPAIDRLDKAFTLSSERQAAVTLGSTVTEPFVKGQRQIRERLRALFMAASLEKREI